MRPPLWLDIFSPKSRRYIRNLENPFPVSLGIIRATLPPPMPSGPQRPTLLICVALVLLVVAAYAHVLDCGFVNYDDNTHVYENSIVLGGLSAEGVRSALTQAHVCLWIPATWISFMAEVSAFGLRSREMHGANLLLHTANAVLLFLFLRRATGRLWPGAAVAGLFAIHPINVESVAWITERKNVLCFFFGLLALHAYTTFAKDRSKSAYWASVVLFALALMAKPMLVPLPAGLLLLDIWPFARLDRSNCFPRTLEKLPFLIASIGASVTTMIGSANAVRGVDGEILPVAARLTNALVSYGAYLRQLLWPSGLCVLYPHTRAVEMLPAFAALLLLIVITIFAWRVRVRHPYVLIGWLWFLGMLVPMLGFIQVGTQSRADRFTYVAQIGVFIAIVWFIADLWGDRPRRLLIYGGAVTAFALLMTTILQVEYWTNGATLFERAIAVTEKNSRAYDLAGLARAQLGDYPAAISHYRDSLRIDTDNAEVWNNLSSALIHVDRNAEAIYAAQQALALRTDYVEARFNLASANERAGQVPQAVAEFRRVTEARPELAAAHYHLGQLLAQQGDRAAARDALHTAAQLRPNDPKIAEALRKVSE